MEFDKVTRYEVDERVFDDRTSAERYVTAITPEDDVEFRAPKIEPVQYDVVYDVISYPSREPVVSGVTEELAHRERGRMLAQASVVSRVHDIVVQQQLPSGETQSVTLARDVPVYASARDGEPLSYEVERREQRAD